MNNKHHFRNTNLVIWVQNSGKIVDKNIPPVTIFYFAHCLRLRDVTTFSFLESQILVPRGPASYLCPGAWIFPRRPWADHEKGARIAQTPLCFSERMSFYVSFYFS